MTALLARRRLDVSAAESVDDLPQVKQIAEPTQIVVSVSVVANPTSRIRSWKSGFYELDFLAS